MFRIVGDPSSGSVERACLKLLVIFFVCVVGVWQRNFEPAVCVCVCVCVHGTCTHTHIAVTVINNALHNCKTESSKLQIFANCNTLKINYSQSVNTFYCFSLKIFKFYIFTILT